MILADLSSISANTWVVNLSDELYFRILERIVFESEVAHVFSTLMRRIHWPIKCDVPVKQVIVDQFDLDAWYWILV
jgi:hypothetical protein